MNNLKRLIISGIALGLVGLWLTFPAPSPSSDDALVKQASIVPLPTTVYQVPVRRTESVNLDLGKDPEDVHYLQAAENFFQSKKKEWNVQEHHEFQPTISKTPIGATVVYETFQEGVKIPGMEVHLFVNTEMEVKEEENGYQALEKGDLAATKMGVDKILETTLAGYGYSENVYSNIGFVLYPVDRTGSPQPAFVIPIEDQSKRPMTAIVNAVTGQVLSINAARAN